MRKKLIFAKITVLLVDGSVAEYLFDLSTTILFLNPVFLHYEIKPYVKMGYL